MSEEYFTAEDLERDFQDQVAKIRSEINVSGRELSAAVGKSNSFFSQIEGHAFLPSMRVFFVMCEHLQIHPRVFFEFGVPTPVEIKRIIDGLTQLDPQERQNVEETINLYLKKKKESQQD